MYLKKTMMALVTALLVSAAAIAGMGNVLAVDYTAEPDQIVCTPYGDLKTQVGLAWVTNQTDTAALAQVMPKGSGGDWKMAATYAGSAGDVKDTINNGAETAAWRWHKVTVTGLKPDTEYLYRVGDGERWSETCEFRTAPEDDSGEPYTFIQINDTQASELAGFEAGQKALEKAAARFPDFRFIVHGGDAVSSGGNQEQWKMYFDTTKNVLRKTVYASMAGNHEYENYDKINWPPRYHDRFHYQTPGYVSGKYGMYYSFDYGNTHFTVMNGKDISKHPEQLQWVKYDQVKNARRWNVILIHQALYSNGGHWDDKEIIENRKVLPPLLIDQLNVDMIFQAHSHIYDRTYPIRNNQPMTSSPVLTNQTVDGLTGVSLWDNPEGTVLQLNNTCGKKYYDFQTAAETKWFVPVNGSPGFQPYNPTYAAVTVTENEIVNTAYYVDGENEVLIESQGVRKTTPDVNPPRNVQRSYANGSMTIRWDEPEAQQDQAVQRYVVYDENNAFTTKYATYFVEANGAKSVSIKMSKAVYDRTDFVVKAIGQHSVSTAGSMTVETDPANPQTRLWVKSLRNGKHQAYTNIDRGISDGSYVTVANNQPDPVKAVCTLAAYDAAGRLTGLYQLGSQEIEPGAESVFSVPAVDTSDAAQVKILAYAGSIDPLRPGGLPLILGRTDE